MGVAGDQYDRPREECGVFGIYAPGEDVARITFFGLYALQHRGQESAGIAVSDGERVLVHKEMGLVSQVFDEETLGYLRGHIAIGHTRYSTTGSSILRNAQPVICDSPLGTLAIGHNGNLVNAASLRLRLQESGVHFHGTSDSEIIARLLAGELAENRDPLEAMRQVMQQISGAYSLVALTPQHLIAARDPHGVRPLCLGRINGHYVVASETCALHVVGAEFVREIEPGEVLVIDHNGLREEQAVPLQRHSLCMFEFIYFARPDSHIYHKTLHEVRRRMGQELAREHPAPGAQVVIPIPDTGIPAALGFSQASGIPYAEGLIKNRYIQRTFIQPDQRMRELGVKIKLNPLREVIAGRKLVMVDDSIVRGTTTGKIVRMLFEAGAKEVHVRITSPPIRYPCFYGIDMATREELVAASHSVEEIRQMIGATSLGYLSIEGMLRAVRMKRTHFCLACFDGKYPIPVPRDVKLSKHLWEEEEPAPAFCGSPEEGET
ncbi:MAG: amidophosphoribosyltransferase [Armatimonadetes bacterium]|nr:amidophosphoribosyltransferase [Armatimonadota bacterium]